MNTPSIIKSYTATIDLLDTEKRSVYGRITTSSPDRINDIILPEAIQTKNYLSNPVVLWNHDWSIPAPAKCLELKRYDTGLDGISEFVQNVQFAEDLYQCVVQKTVRSISIGFNAISSKMSKTGERIFTDIEMLEYSFCNIGMNPEALTKALEIVKTPYLKEQFEYQKKTFELEDKVNGIFESNKSLEQQFKNYSELEMKLKEYENMENKINQINESINQQHDTIKNMNIELQKLLSKDVMKTKNVNFEEQILKSLYKKLGLE